MTSHPILTMLWEAADPLQALQARFGFRDAEAAARWLAGTVRQHWGLQTSQCERIVLSDHNALAWIDTSAGPVVAKWSVVTARFRRLAALAELTTWLDGCAIPVSKPLAALDGRLQLEVDGASLGLQHAFDAAPLDVTDPTQVRAAGTALARLHDALRGCSWADRLADVSAPPAPLTVRIGDWLDTAPEHLPTPARDALRRLIEAGSDELATQLVHGDVRSANVLWAGSRIAAILDFEEARIDHPVVELARSAVLLGTRFRDWGPVSAEVRATFLGGYQTHRRLSSVEQSWWCALVLWHSLMMVPLGDDATGWGPAALEQLTQIGRTG